MQKNHYPIKISKFSSIYYFEFSKDFYHDPERHASWEMVYVDSGSINAITNGIGCTLTEGQAIFHEPMELHAHVSDKKVPNNMLVVAFYCDSKEMDFFKGKTFKLDKTSKMLLTLFLEEAKNTFGEVPGDFSKRNLPKISEKEFGAYQLLESHFSEFLIKLIRSGNGSKVVSNRQSRIIANNSACELICEYMKRNITSALTTSEICEHFLIGKTQLCKIFQEYTGKSPMEYYSELKITEAKKLLRNKKMSVSQISDFMNYSSIHNFSRAFRKITGVSPTAYIKSIR